MSDVGAGTCTITAASGVTLNGTDAEQKTCPMGRTRLYKIDTNTWITSKNGTYSLQEVKNICDLAEKYQLDGRDVLKDYSIEEIAEIYNAPTRFVAGARPRSPDEFHVAF